MSVLAAPLVALVSVPLEAVAALARRGGEMRVTVAPVRARGSGELERDRGELVRRAQLS